MAERDFKGVWIPKEIWLDERLNALDKVILTEIISLDDENEHCHAGNDYLAQFCQCSESKVSKTISKLIELGYIRVFSFDGRVRKLQGCIGFFTMRSSTFYEAESENVLPININNNINIKKSIKKVKPCDFPGFDDFWKAYPNKVKKDGAMKIWNKIKPDDSLFRAIMMDIDRRTRGEWNGIDKKYVPHPTTYLNQRRWEDEDSGGSVQRQEPRRLNYFNSHAEYEASEAEADRILHEMRIKEGLI